MSCHYPAPCSCGCHAGQEGHEGHEGGDSRPGRVAGVWQPPAPLSCPFCAAVGIDYCAIIGDTELSAGELAAITDSRRALAAELAELVTLTEQLCGDELAQARDELARAEGRDYDQWRALNGG